MRALRLATAIVFGVAALYLVWSTAWLLGNHLFEWSPDKVSLEWRATLIFAAWWTAVGLGLAAVAGAFFQKGWRLLFLLTFGSGLLVAIALFALKLWRAEPVYVWLPGALLLVGGYAVVRWRRP